MKPQLSRVGAEQSPVVIIDEFSGRVDEVIEIAEQLAPYPRVDSYYPGVRRVITRDDKRADDYVVEVCERAGQFIGGAFDLEQFTLVEASFSIVATPPGKLSPAQRSAHFDSPDPNYLALLHYLRVPRGSGTAFYRQRSTGIERVSEASVARFVTAAQRESALLPPDSGYITGSNDFFEQIGVVEAVPDRLIIYQGSLLHSGVIPSGMTFSADPREGRLTANLFIRGGPE